jgi:hypothetical protein
MSDPVGLHSRVFIRTGVFATFAPFEINNVASCDNSRFKPEVLLEHGSSLDSGMRVSQIPNQAPNTTNPFVYTYRIQGTARNSPGYIYSQIRVKTFDPFCREQYPIGSNTVFPENQQFWFCLVSEPPVVTPGQTFTANAGIYFQQNVLLESSLTKIPQDIFATGLPEGLSISLNKKPRPFSNSEPQEFLPVISGTPQTTGTFTANIRVVNIVGETITPVTISVEAVTRPTISASAISLRDFSTFTILPSASQSFIVSGAMLAGNISATASSGFEVSLDDSFFSNFVTIDPILAAQGAVLYVRIKTNAPEGFPFGTVTLNSSGADTKIVFLEGRVFPQTFGLYADLVNGQTFTAIKGSFFRAQLLATGPVIRFELPPAWVTTPFPGWMSLSASGIISGTPPDAIANQTISVALIGPNNQSVENFQISVLDAAIPTINISPSTLTGFSTTAGVPSLSRSFRVSGTSLQEGISISSSSGFQVSNNNSLFLDSLILSPTGNSVPETDLFARLGASAPTGSASGTLTISSAGAATKTISLSGSVAAALSRPVTFSVNMILQISLGRFSPAFDRVEVRGVFNDFAGTELFDLDGDGIYSGTITINGGQGTAQNYKFFVPQNLDLSWETGSDRIFTLGVGNTAQILDVVYFDNIATLSPILVGTSQISSLYVGGNAVTRMHLGEVQVFP